MEEILLMQVAATLAGFELADLQPLSESDYPIVVNPDKTVTVSPTDLAKQRKWVVWETFRTYYWPLVQALADSKDWPQPNVPTAGGAGTLSATLSQLAPLVTALGGPAGLAAAIPALIKDFTSPAPTTPTPTNVPPLPTTTGS